MDSMRSLNSSLPRPSPQNRRRQPNSELLQAFKAAALSVTQLYKTAAADDECARESHSAGYLDALNDLLAFLDAQNIGLGDGEGWQVRTWATQQHQTLTNAPANGDAENTVVEEEEKIMRNTSPSMQQRPSPQHQASSAPPDPIPNDVPKGSARSDSNQMDMFRFSSPASPPSQPSNLCGSTHTSPVRLEVVPRSTKTAQHRGSHHSRATDRMPAISLGSLGHGAGSKRKLPLHEFFDISGSGATKDGHSSGKRGRMT